MNWLLQHPLVLIVVAWLVSLCAGPWIASPWLMPDGMLAALALLFLRTQRRLLLEPGALAAILAALTAIDHPGKAGALYLAVWLAMMGVTARFDVQQPRLQWLIIAMLVWLTHLGWVVIFGRLAPMLLIAATGKALLTLGVAWTIDRWAAPSRTFG